MINSSFAYFAFQARGFFSFSAITCSVLLLLNLVLLLLLLLWLQRHHKTGQVYHREQENLRRILHDLNIATWSYELNLRRLAISPDIENIIGYSARDLMQQPALWVKLAHPYDLPRVREAEGDLRVGKKIMLEHRILLANGACRWIYSLVTPQRDTNGRVARLEGLVIDVTEQKELEEKMKHMAFYDALTGLPNRSMFENYFTNFMTRGRQFPQRLAIVFIDLDAFKAVNDELGHDAGDLLLKEVATRLKDLLRGGDLLSRLGGDEFIALLTRLKNESPLVVAQRIVDAFQEAFVINGHSLIIGASIGISVYPDDGEDLETLIKNADQAMYMAKRKGKNTCCVYNPSILSHHNKG